MSKFTRYLFVLAFLAFSISYSFAQLLPPRFQNFSIADHLLLEKKVMENPEVLGKYVMYEENLRNIINDITESPKGTLTDTTQNGRKIIPVVFHIIHNFGIENISAEQIHDAIERLNIDYNKLNSDTTAQYSWPTFTSRRADCKIEYRLAKIDPNGNITDGIVRHYDERTNYAYYDICSTYAWDPKKYLNVYSVSFIYPEGINLPDGAAIGGMSVFPPSNPLTPLFTGGDTLADGVLIRHDGIGGIGTATNMMGQGINALNRTFTHELGHYYNLYHPFQNLKLSLGTIPCMGADGCSTSGSGLCMFVSLNNDEVADTPPVITANQNTSLSCIVPGSRNTCSNNVSGYGDEVDMVENYMDYQFGYCTNIFTTGQLARINATMMGDRRELWSLENLIASGVFDTSYHPVGIPHPDFNPNTKMVCTGSSITFTEYSYNATPDLWEWSFPGGNPATSMDTTPVITYDNPGVYSATLKVTNAQGSDSITRHNLITVVDPSNPITGNNLEGFETISVPNTNGWIIYNQDGKNTWTLTDSASYAGTKSLRVANFYENTAGSVDEIITPVYNFGSMSPLTPLRIKYRMSYAAKKVPSNALAEMLYGTNTADTIYDKLYVYYSTNCGSTWNIKKSYNATQMVTAGLDSNSFVPNNISQWREELLAFVGVTANSANVRLKFTFYSKGGNNIYIDNLSVGDVSTDFTEIEKEENLDFSFYPNPMNESSVLSFNTLQKENVSVDIYDLLGRKICNIFDGVKESGNNSFEITKSMMQNSGIYFVKISVDSTVYVKKLVKK